MSRISRSRLTLPSARALSVPELLGADGVLCALAATALHAINEGSDQHGHVFYRFFNEVPVLFLFGIVILAVLKPF